MVSQFYEGITLSKHFTMLLRITRPSSQPAEAEEASGGLKGEPVEPAGEGKEGWLRAQGAESAVADEA